MKRFLTVLTALVVAVGALVQCKPYDDAWIKEELADLKAQVANLQSSVNALDAYKTLLDKSRLISEVKDHGNGTHGRRHARLQDRRRRLVRHL